MLSGRLAETIARIANDRTDGAAILTRRAAEALASISDPELAVEAAQALSAGQPSMASIQRLSERVYEEPDRVREIARDTLELLATAPARIAANAAKVVRRGATVMTNSYSSTVLAVLKSLAPTRIFVAQSLPGGEGVTLARELGQNAVSIADSTIYRYMRETEYVVVGADCVSRAGVSNKVGTAVIALAARECERPVYAVCDTGKFIARPLPEGELFEVTPIGWFSGIITEEGIRRGV